MKTENQNRGKLTIKDCKTSSQETTFLMKKALKSVNQRRELEKTHEFVSIRIDRKTVKQIEMSKYLKNKEYYDKLNVSLYSN